MLRLKITAYINTSSYLLIPAFGETQETSVDIEPCISENKQKSVAHEPVKKGKKKGYFAEKRKNC